MQKIQASTLAHVYFTSTILKLDRVSVADCSTSLTSHNSSCKTLRCDSWPGTHIGKCTQGNRPVLQLDLYSHGFLKPYTFHNYIKKLLIRVWKLGNQSFANNISLRPVLTITSQFCSSYTHSETSIRKQN